MAEFTELRQKLQQSDSPKLVKLLTLLIYAADFIQGVIRLTWAHLLRVVILCYSAEQLYLLGHLIN